MPRRLLPSFLLFALLASTVSAAAGVTTPKELATRNPDHLLEALTKVNAEKKLVRALPVKSQIEGWIASAKTLKPMVD